MSYKAKDWKDLPDKSTPITAAELNRMDKGIEEVTTQLAEKATSNDLLTSIAFPRLIAHRGYRVGAPENTIPAFEMAGELGYWGMECDVQVTSDGVWIVNHDLTVDKMTDGTGNIADMTYAEIQSFTIDNGFNVGLYPNTKLPTLDDFLYICKKYGVVPVIEIKVPRKPYTTTDYDNFVSIVRRHGLEYNSIMISGGFDICMEIRNRSKTIVIHPLALITQPNLDFVKSLGNASINTDATKVTKQEVELAHSQGVSVGCFTAKTHNDLQRLIDMGIDFITVDGVII